MRRSFWLGGVAGIALLSTCVLLGQSPTPPPPPTTTATSSSQNAGAVLRVHVNLVLVPVVVRDSGGHAVGSLRAEDFTLLDNNKPQQIVSFSVEQPGAQPTARGASTNATGSAAPTGGQGHVFVAPRSFTAVYFDDVHLETENMNRVRGAAQRYLTKVDLATERLGIFTTSGKIALDFTDDRNKLNETLARLKSEHLPGTGMGDCPTVTYQQANAIINQGDSAASALAMSDAITQCHVRDQNAAAEMAQEAAQRALEAGDRESRVSFGALQQAVAHLATTPGERNLLLASSGFMTTEGNAAQIRIIDVAVRSHITISALDARGLYGADLIGDATERGSNPALAQQKVKQKAEYDVAVEGVMASLSAETGGAFYRSSNDLDAGFQRIGGAPEFVYLLGFSPASAKPDGKLHALKVAVNSKEKYNVSARRNYLSAPQNPGSEDAANREVQQALYTSVESRELPMEVRIQTVKGDGEKARLTVAAHIDLNQMPAGTADNEKHNQLLFATVIFDRNGKYIDGNSRTIAVRWKDDDTVDPAERSAAKAYESNFMLGPGDYVVRFVARDSEVQQLFAETTPVVIQ
ncbi:MAG: VWA domain-containing protein [Acidobacteria bacterium]|nr:VWA domain-containing protein [Acidobacteriota bacterium]